MSANIWAGREAAECTHGQWAPHVGKTLVINMYGANPALLGSLTMCGANPALLGSLLQGMGGIGVLNFIRNGSVYEG